MYDIHTHVDDGLIQHCLTIMYSQTRHLDGTFNSFVGYRFKVELAHSYVLNTIASLVQFGIYCTTHLLFSKSCIHHLTKHVQFLSKGQLVI